MATSSSPKVDAPPSSPLSHPATTGPASMLALNCAAHKPAARMEIPMLNNDAVSIREDDKDEKFVIRLPTGMRGRVRGAAKANHRSMNSEIVSRIDATLRHEQEIARLKAVIDVLLNGGTPATNVVQLAEVGQ
ncbi:Arc-like DNA binding protein [Pseudomonas syringae pv. viburni]|uniref:Arc-like DNA binding protein n=2 Tax=Pseudomonas syringae group genomosp. 3 TaxID=251701 RepID=A0A0Q0D1M2_9PSED|nr:Arc-like DNA binding protein [Pseudomonas syringae pv. viburni]